MLFRSREPDHWISGLKDLTTHAEQTARIMVEAEKYFLEETPEIVLVCGDANFNFACGVAARKLRLTLGHVESGLRSYDMRTPEEHNRRMLDHISDFLFAPTNHSVETLERENVPGTVIFTGNTVVDSLKIALDKLSRDKTHRTLRKNYILLTMHREENVDDINALRRIIEGLRKISDAMGIPIFYPAHPRTINRLKEFGLMEKMNKIVNVCPSLPYLDFIDGIKNAQLVLTDSGGVQEEACSLQVPAVILRKSTERPESLRVGASMLATEPDAILEAAKMMMVSPRLWANPFDPFMDGNAAGRIVDALGLE